MALLEGTQDLVGKWLGQLIKTVDQIRVAASDVLPRLEIGRRDASPVLVVPRLVLVDFNESTEAYLAFCDFNAGLLAFCIAADGAVVWGDL